MSKFFQQGQDLDDNQKKADKQEENQNQLQVKSKFFEEDNDEQDQEQQKESKQDKPVHSKFLNQEENEEDEQGKVDAKKTEEKPVQGSKFFNVEEDEEKPQEKEEKQVKGSKFFNQDENDQKEDEQQEKEAQNQKKDSKKKKSDKDKNQKKEAAGSKFFQEEDEEDKEKAQEKQGENKQQSQEQEQQQQQPAKKFLSKDEKKKLKELKKQQEEKELMEKFESIQVEKKVTKKNKQKETQPQQAQQESVQQQQTQQESVQQSQTQSQVEGAQSTQQETSKQTEVPQDANVPQQSESAKELGDASKPATGEGEEEQKQGKEQTKASKNNKKKDKNKEKGEQNEQEGGLKKDKKKGGKVNAVALKILQEQQRKRELEELVKKEEEERKRKEDEERKKQEEEERLRKEDSQKKREIKQNKIKQLKDQGEFVNRSQQEKEERLRIQREQFLEQQKKQQEDFKKKKEQERLLREQMQQQELSKQQQQQQQQQQVQSGGEQKQSEKDQKVVENWENLDKNAQTTNSAQSQNAVKQEENQTVEKKQIIEESKLLEHVTDKFEESKQENPFQAQQLGKEGEVLRSPIICVLGHVDTGKTTLLDKLRNTNVQEGEAGGITQQIGATYFPGDRIRNEIVKCQSFYKVDLRSPGLLVIDTPGHESFSNLRNRGSSLCDFAILVVDLMHGLENQTLESLELLKMRKTPFVIALNKIDRAYNWQKKEFASSYLQLQGQEEATKTDFENKYKQTLLQLNQKGYNVAMYWENKDPSSYFSVVPTSGVTGEGIPDLLSVISKYTQIFMKNKMVVKQDEFNCTVMEVKMIEGLGATIDCILVDGVLRQGDHIIILGFAGPIKTKIRALLTPHPMKEMRVKGEYLHHKEIYASMGLKISAPDLEDAVAGSQLFLGNTPEQEEYAMKEVMKDLENVKEKADIQKTGVGVAASTLGSLEALLEYLKGQNIPISYVTVGPISKDDVMKAMKSILAENPETRKKEYATMLAFDIKILDDAQKFADENGVKIFNAKIIYHLFTQFMDYVKQIQEERKKQNEKDATFPCKLSAVKFFRNQDPIVMGVDVELGTLKPGITLCTFNKESVKVGIVESIERNHKNLPFAKKEHGSVAIRIKNFDKIMAGRSFTLQDKLVSVISRRSINLLKEYFKKEVQNEEWDFIKNELKPFFQIA